MKADVAGLLAILDSGTEAPNPAAEQIAEEPATPVTRQGNLWLVGPRRILRGDCRDAALVAELMGGQKAAIVVTSPPYATQRPYDPMSGFQPILSAEYVAWYRAVAQAVVRGRAPSGNVVVYDCIPDLDT